MAEAVKAGQIGGAAIDVFPVEPKSPGQPFESPLRGLDNVILTPHIGGSTAEAQENIGGEVAEKLIKYSNNGSTVGAAFGAVSAARSALGRIGRRKAASSR